MARKKDLLEEVKKNKDKNLVDIYNKMVQLALEGNVQSANWVVNFSNSDFFKSSKSEIDKLVEGLNLNE